MADQEMRTLLRQMAAQIAQLSARIRQLEERENIQYAMLAGRNGGQVLQGGTASGDDLTLESTSHATKGDVLLNPNGGNVGIGITPTTYSLELKGDAGILFQAAEATDRFKVTWTDLNGAVATLHGGNGALQTQISGNSNNESFFSASPVVIGDTSSAAHLQYAGQQLAVVNAGDQLGGMALGTYAPGDGYESFLDFLKSGTGTIGTHASVASGENLGALQWSGSDGTAFRAAAKIAVEVDGTPGASDMPGRIEFFTTPDGSATLVERMRLTSAGLGGIGAAVPTPAAQWHVDQSSSTAAIPVLLLDQSDVSEELIEVVSTAGVGNAVELVGGKTLTVTEFWKVTSNGNTRYIPLGTIA